MEHHLFVEPGQGNRSQYTTRQPPCVDAPEEIEVDRKGNDKGGDLFYGVKDTQLVARANVLVSIA